jgi:hypothetical protein
MNAPSQKIGKLQFVAKSIATCKKNPYIINQNHIFSQNYCEVIVYIVIVYLLIMFIWVVFICT